MLRKLLAAAAGVVLAMSVSGAGAVTPFGGDDTGNVPTAKAALVCENGIGKAVGKAVGCIGVCTAKRADGKFTSDGAEDACEKGGTTTCLAKFTATATKLQSKAAGACNCVNVSNIATVIEDELDALNILVYCDPTSGTLFGGDDTGFIPTMATRKCEDGVTKLVGKAVACIAACHAKRASGKFTSDTPEDACEKGGTTSCLAKFSASVGKLKGCPSCINAPSLSNTFEGILDASDSMVYCASPSGAFLDE